MTTSKTNPREPHAQPYYITDPTPLPSHIPSVPEIGATSAPLLSASYFIGARCAPYNEDFMLCRSQSRTGETDCLKEGRRVTRCAISVLEDINKNCQAEFRKHWGCLDNENHDLSRCRLDEAPLNACVAKFLNLTKVIPNSDGTPINDYETPSFFQNKVRAKYEQ
ncbi:NADH-ubiquinone oxidoreductase-like protein 20.8 kDa subunit [Lipomyces doorenjongii]